MDVPANGIYSGPMTHLLSLLCVLMKIIHVAVWKRRWKGLRVSYFALLLVVFKRHPGSEGVKTQPWSYNRFLISLLWVAVSRSGCVQKCQGCQLICVPKHHPLDTEHDSCVLMSPKETRLKRPMAATNPAVVLGRVFHGQFCQWLLLKVGFSIKNKINWVF